MTFDGFSDNEALQIFWHQDPGRDRINLYIYHRRSNGRFAVAKRVDETSGILFETVEEGARLEPFLSLPGLWAKEFFKAMAKGLEDEGFKTQKAARLEALVEEKDKRIADLKGMIRFLSKGGVLEDLA